MEPWRVFADVAVLMLRGHTLQAPALVYRSHHYSLLSITRRRHGMPNAHTHTRAHTHTHTHTHALTHTHTHTHAHTDLDHYCFHLHCAHYIQFEHCATRGQCRLVIAHDQEAKQGQGKDL